MQQLEEWPIDRLIDYARNPRKNDHAVDTVAGAIREFGFKVPIVAKSDGTVVDGHLRLKAAKKLKLETVPVLLADDLTDAQVRAFRLSVNKLAELAEWDSEMLANELSDLHADEFDLGVLGFDADELAKLLEFEDASSGDGSGEAAGESQYTNKITAPIYEPKGERPPIKDLSDKTKTNELCSEIEKAELPEDIRGFLLTAAQRHTVFNFRNIAEFYCHASADVQHLMERSGLIIIDMDKAIANGFVHLSERLGAIADLELSEAEDA
jgi:hypothetical protein